MSYNILAEMYLNRDYLTEFQYCPRYAVELAYRTPLLLKEILGYNNDILCLQEVGRELFRDDLLPSLEAFDFEGHYREKGGGTAEGTAIFFRKSKFRYLGQHDILIIDHLETDAGCVDILQKTYSNGNFKEAFKRNFQTVQVLVLEPTDSPGHKLVVANTHLYYYPTASHIRLIQAVVAMRHLHDVLQIYQQQDGKSKVSLVFCGDFNVLPDSMVYEFMTKKQTRGDHTDMQTIPKDQYVPDMCFSHNQNLASACGILPYTCYTELCQDMLDYIFYDVDNLEVERIIPQHDHEDVQQYTAFPSVVNPSDHIAQVCDLKWK
ncbi:hypothetical protein ACJMK2_014205 [Sinanodonta woodiana]|uniref:Endonuclease/exonuclease/phosphatase domain-containing protein n=1 Tax=Sinanodonta woodiana TaxID=1069815 RepID=A0ABD3V0R0_SINWO